MISRSSEASDLFVLNEANEIDCRKASWMEFRVMRAGWIFFDLLGIQASCDENRLYARVFGHLG